MRKGVVLVAVILAALFGGYRLLAAPVMPGAEREQFVVSSSATKADVLERLDSQGFIRSEAVFAVMLELRGGKILPGGYLISKSMNIWEIAGVFRDEPALLWVRIPEGLRKEEVAELLGEALEWTPEKVSAWLAATEALPLEYQEGVYFPDTYLIPRDEAPEATVTRFRRRFDEQFAPLAEEAMRQNIRWPTLVKIASLVQREAAGPEDMAIIAGVIWNRLLDDMKLDIDATLQYARGKTDKGYWSPISPAEKELDSPYNTYIHKGLPPTPIANPGVEAMRAVLFPEKTNCLYYLHDESRAIHCAATYEEHRENIETYLR